MNYMQNTLRHELMQIYIKGLAKIGVQQMEALFTT